MKFFRKYRKQLIPGSKFRKYVLYAIGEIVLVVVGILIALQVNNSNINKQHALDTHKTAELVWIQMAKDTIEIGKILREWDLLVPTGELILYDTKPGDAISKKCSSCPGFILSITLPTITERVPTLIQREPLREGELEARLFEIEAIYKEGLKTVDFYESTISGMMTDNFKYLNNNHDWFAEMLTHGTCNSDCWEYYSTSSDFRNRAAMINHVTYDSYYGELETFKDLLKYQIDELLKVL